MSLPSLPIDEVLPEITARASEGAFVLVAPPGAGKTTRVPPALASKTAGVVWVVEPRRVAARAAARRMAHEAGEPVGQRFGWHVRFDRKVSAQTRVVVVTEGILLRRLQSDPFLEGIDVVLLDEFHERSILADLCLALLAEVRADARPDLSLGVMSATLDPEPVAAFLGGAPVIRSDGRTWPVQTTYRGDLESMPLASAVAAAVRSALSELDGDILAFLPGVREIRHTGERLRGVSADVLPLHGRLPTADQDRALSAGQRRRVVLATNVAESSVTVPGVRVVVDSGWVRQPRFDVSTGLPRLDTVRISAASADQRAGRAGRRGPGHALRLWSERVQHALDPFDAPEIQHADLAGPVLQLLAWGTDPHRFRWFEAPPAHAMEASHTLLEALGATRSGALTALGRTLAALPLHPRLAALVAAGARLGAARPAATAAAMLADGPLRLPDRPRRSPSDVLDAVEDAHLEPPLRRVVDQLVKGVAAVVPEEAPSTDEALARAVLAGWPDRVARRRAPDSPRARLVGGRGVVVDRRSGVHDAPLFVAVDVQDATPEGKVRVASEVHEDWLEVVEEIEVGFEDAVEAVRARRVRRHRDLVLASHPVETPRAEAGAALATAAATRLHRALPGAHALDPLRARIAFVAAQVDDQWPVADEPFLRELLPALCHGRSRLAEVRSADWVGAVRDALGWPRWQALQRLAPERYEAPSGRSFSITWAPDAAPVLEIPMQHLFGLTRTPSVADGRVPLTLHLLAPNGRPQQITDDLPGFWSRTWPEVRKELRARYPKHAWPEDPLTAAPGGPRRRRR